MRLQQTMHHNNTNYESSQFASWVLGIGNGTANSISIPNDEESDWVKIPEDLLLKKDNGDNEDIMCLIQNVYSEFFKQSVDHTYLQERVILAPTNEDVDKINDIMLGMLADDKKVYLSADTITDIQDDEQNTLYTPEFLNTLKFSGLPNHSLEVKVGVPIKLLRNLNQSIGLCNGTRLIVKQTGAKIIEAEITTGNRIGERVCIPRIIMSPTDTEWPFTFKRRQFPVRVTFALTINKSQGQTLAKVGLYLPRQVFTYGQLYVAISRVTSRSGLKILSSNKENEPQGYTKNVVYKEVLAKVLNSHPQTTQNIMPIQDYEIFERLRIHWKIKARVCRIWHEFEVQRSATRKRFLRVLLIDEKGEQMQLTLQDTEIQSLGVNLREGTVVSIDRVKVVEAQKAYKVVPSDYQMYLRHDSIIQEINEVCSDIPSNHFYFKTFDQLPGLVNDIKYLTDVIGIVRNVSGISTIRKKDNTITQKMDIIMLDKSEQTASLTLWGEIISIYREQLSSTAQIGKILIAASLLVREFNGNWYLSSTYSTKLIFNSEIDEAQQLQTWYAEHKDLHSTILVNPSNEKRGTIMEWKNYKQHTHTSNIMLGIKATIFRAKLDQRIWYLACIKCGKKAQRNNPNSSCQVCNLSTTETYPRYIVRLTLIDHTDTLNVVLFDDEVAHILKASKDELSTLIGDENEVDKVAEKLRGVLWKYFIFYLKVNRNISDDANQSCPVTKISDIDYVDESKRLLSLVSAP